MAYAALDADKGRKSEILVPYSNAHMFHSLLLVFFEHAERSNKCKEHSQLERESFLYDFDASNEQTSQK